MVKKDGEGNFLFQSPMEVVVAPNSDIVVSDSGHCLKIFTPSFVLKATYRSPFAKSELWGMCVDRTGRIFVADWNHGVHVLSNTTEARFEGIGVTLRL